MTVQDVATANSDCGNGWTWTRTYTIKDACDNEVTPKPTMSVSGKDNAAPTLINGKSFPTLANQNACFANADTTGLLDANEVAAMYEDCGTITVTVQDAATASNDCVNGWTWTRTYTIKELPSFFSTVITNGYAHAF